MEKYFRWMPFATYTAVLTYLLLIPSDRLPSLLAETSDKILHFLAFALLMLLYLAGLSNFFIRRKVHMPYLVAGFAGLSLFSGLLEIFQYFIPGRSGSLADFGFNNLGLLAGGFFARMVNCLVSSCTPSASD
ncbi:VanZ like protein [Schleiferia thermophila]|uniref:VanZ like protein n=2 Tax=Schleiferia thermophila TaxID=884107 RepID=A0A368ZYK0_9FLAO|nr:VanZ like protein [Schleiferia thermophila]GCD80630.1 hypothetical protein JCM30197_18770 [Schleiferia thermophila]